MGHNLRALLMPPGIARRATTLFGYARAFALPQEIALIPLTDELLEGLEARDEANETWRDSNAQSLDAVDRIAKQLSTDGVVAHIETEYFGGTGSQSAIAWLNGQVVLGPLQGNRGADQPINQALRLLGVRAFGSDEFDAVGLGLIRETEDWLTEGTPV